MSREIGLPFCRALQAFAAGEYRACVETLLPVRYMNHRLGGSHAQRDIIAWTLVEAALRSGDGDMSLALANERCQLKPSSPQNWRLVARAHVLRGDQDRARRAWARGVAAGGVSRRPGRHGGPRLGVAWMTPVVRPAKLPADRRGTEGGHESG